MKQASALAALASMAAMHPGLLDSLNAEDKRIFSKMTKGGVVKPKAQPMFTRFETIDKEKFDYDKPLENLNKDLAFKVNILFVEMNLSNTTEQVNVFEKWSNQYIAQLVDLNKNIIAEKMLEYMELNRDNPRKKGFVSTAKNILMAARMNMYNCTVATIQAPEDPKGAISKQGIHLIEEWYKLYLRTNKVLLKQH